MVTGYKNSPDRELPPSMCVNLARESIMLPGFLEIDSSEARAIRFGTLEAICRVLDCQPGDILEYVE